LDRLTPLPNQTRRDSWASIRDLLYVNLKNSGGRYSLSQVLGEHAMVKQIHQKGSREIREALKELAGINPDQPLSGEKAEPVVPYWSETETAREEK
jgi:EH domain-containing protein 1